MSDRRKAPDVTTALILLSAASKSGYRGTIELAAQFADVLPCEFCDYVWNHCKCSSPHYPKDEP